LLLLAVSMVWTLLFLFCMFANWIIPIWDQNHEFTAFTASILPFISVMTFFDILQVVLSGALRGAANVKVVMLTRLCTIFLVVMPLSYVAAHMHINDPVMKFVLIFGSFYIGGLFMTIVYMLRFRGEAWKGRFIN
jgi:Na+-driven multidrug efflux pump